MKVGASIEGTKMTTEWNQQLWETVNDRLSWTEFKLGFFFHEQALQMIWKSEDTKIEINMEIYKRLTKLINIHYETVRPGPTQMCCECQPR